MEWSGEETCFFLQNNHKFSFEHVYTLHMWAFSPNTVNLVNERFTFWMFSSFLSLVQVLFSELEEKEETRKNCAKHNGHQTKNKKSSNSELRIFNAAIVFSSYSCYGGIVIHIHIRTWHVHNAIQSNLFFSCSFAGFLFRKMEFSLSFNCPNQLYSQSLPSSFQRQLEEYQTKKKEFFIFPIPYYSTNRNKEQIALKAKKVLNKIK